MSCIGKIPEDLENDGSDNTPRSPEYKFLDNISDIRNLLIEGKKEEAQKKADEMIELIYLGEIIVFGKESIAKFLAEEKLNNDSNH